MINCPHCWPRSRPTCPSSYVQVPSLNFHDPPMLCCCWINTVLTFRLGLYILCNASTVQFSEEHPIPRNRPDPCLMIEDAAEIVEDGSIQWTVIVFHSLDIFALALVSMVLTTAMTARKIRRLRTWYTYLWTQLLLTVAFLLHPFKPSNYKPAYVPCLIQAMLVYATPPTYVSVHNYVSSYSNTSLE